MAKPLVIVFARAPRYGAVKTRLAQDIGHGEALRFHRTTLGRVLRRIGRDGRWDVMLAVTPDRAVHERGLWPARIRLSAQGGGDLGRRMIRALRQASPRLAVLIGSDIPELESAHIATAFRALGSAAFVLGPARDGGYWLIGARHGSHAQPGALDGVRWSGPQALADTRARLGQVAVLSAVLDDVDDGAAFAAWRRKG